MPLLAVQVVNSTFAGHVKEEDVVVGEDGKSHKKIIEHEITGMVKQSN